MYLIVTFTNIVIQNQDSSIKKIIIILWKNMTFKWMDKIGKIALASIQSRCISDAEHFWFVVGLTTVKS